jgi:flagellar biosynthesis protein FliR
LLAMIDLALAMLGRINSHLQVITIAFPVKMMVSLFMLGSILVLVPSLYDNSAHRILDLLRALLTRP